jgi:hypothetical protein
MCADSEKLILFYITHDHNVSNTGYGVERWGTAFNLGTGHATAPKSRHLSVTSIGNNTNLTTNATADQVLLLLYESPGGNITAFSGSFLKNGSTSCGELQVMDISSRGSMALPPYIPPDCPVAFGGGLTVAPPTEAASYDDGSRPTLYESRPEATFSVPFTSAQFLQSEVQAVFYAPSNNSILWTVYDPQMVVDQRMRTGVHQLAIFLLRSG